MSSLSRAFAEQIERRAAELARRWLDALIERLPESSRTVLPGRSNLDHIPLLMRRVGESFAGDTATPVDLETSQTVIHEIARLAETRRHQGLSLEEFIVEFDLLERILLEVLEDACSEVPDCGRGELMTVVRQLQSAMSALVGMAGHAFNQSVTSDRHDRAQMLDGFSRAVSHELRNRLNAAVLMLTTVRRKLPTIDAAADKLLDRLERNLRDIDGVVGDVFAVAVSHGRVAVDETGREPMSAVVERLVGEASPLAEQHGVELTMADDIPDVLIDGPRLQLALVNLLSNAIKYADPDKPQRWVRVEVEFVDETRRRCELRVTDNGIGVPAEERTRIFERFVRGRTVGQRAGLGLGLSLTAEAVAQMGGELWVDSVAGEGSTFVIALTLSYGLPVAPAEVPVDIDEGL